MRLVQNDYEYTYLSILVVTRDGTDARFLASANADVKSLDPRIRIRM